MVDVNAADVGLALVPVEPVDMELGRLMHVDRVFVDERLGGEDIDLADDTRPIRRRVDDHDVLLGGRPQRNRRGREVLARPVPAVVAGTTDESFFAEEGQKRFRFGRAESLPRLERQLEAGRLQMAKQDMNVVGIEPSLFRRRVQQEFRMLDDVPIDRPAAGDQHRHAGALPATRPPHLLPGGGDRTRIPGENRDVELADVHAELESVGAHDAEQLAAAQPTLHRPPLGWQVSTAIAADLGSGAVARAQRLAKGREHKLDADS